MNNNKLLIVVDMQNDFIDGVLGTADALNIVPIVVDKMKKWNGDIICTRDTHSNIRCHTIEERYLPLHCIEETDGQKLHRDILHAITQSRRTKYDDIVMNKSTFGSIALPEIIRYKGYQYIELVGLCTDICVISNALLLRIIYPSIIIAVDASCCAGTTPQLHSAALEVMKSCQVIVYEGDDRL